ncbi:MAG: hypothetical protein IJY87_00605 [Bacilli bacterium]|nr:hypothetical protein [Bacilli bacterium]
MKKFYSMLLLVLAVVLMPTLVLAEGNVAEVNGTGYDTIEKALTAAEGTDKEVKLLQDVTLAATKVVNKDLTINLNGHSIKYTSLLFEVYGAEFTVTGTGSLEETTPDYAPIAVYGSATNEDDFASVVNVGEGVTLKGWSGIMVRQHAKYSAKTADSNDSYGVEVNFAGKIISVLDSGNGTGSGIYVNGNILHTTNAPVINIAKTANITSLGVGILSAGYSVVTVEGGSIVGDESGIEMRAGELYVKGGTIKSTATKLEVVPNGNGSTTIGAGIAVAQHTTANVVKVEVTGGEIIGYVAFNEANPEQNTTDEVKDVDLTIKGGSFETTNTAAGAKAVSSETQTEFVQGGEFNVAPTDEAIADTMTKKEENGVVYVGKESNVTVKDATNGEVKADRTTAVEGQTVTLTITAAKGYKLDKVVVKDAAGKEVTVTDGKFVMPGSNVEVSATFVAETPEVPKTGDSVMLFVALGFMSIAAIAFASNNLKRRTTR